jgi:hypothetical protein
MKRIAVIGTGGQEAAANLIGNTLSQTTGWNVRVLSQTGRGKTSLEQRLSRLDGQGCQCAVAALGPESVKEGLAAPFQLGILTDWREMSPPAAVNACAQLVVNLDDPCGRLLARGRRGTLTYSEGKDQADLTAKYLRCYPTCTEFDALTWREIRRVRMPVMGGYDVYQGLAALSCGLSLGLSLEALVKSVEKAKGLPGHLEELTGPQDPFRIVVDGAVSAAQVESLLLTLSPLKGEGGALRLRLGRPLAGERGLTLDVATELADQVEVRTPPAEEQILGLLEAAGPGDLVVVAGVHSPGSTGDERKIIRQWLEQKRRNGQR